MEAVSTDVIYSPHSQDQHTKNDKYVFDEIWYI